MSKANSNNSGSAIPAVAYIRMSSDKQDASPGQQRAELKKLAARDGYHVVREYFDDAISGDRTDKRHAFQRMIRDAAGGKFKAILCWDQDRFGRFDSMEAGYWIHPLRQAGVKLVTVAQGVIDWSDFASRIVYSVTQEGKHSFLRDLSRNSLRGKLVAVKRGEWQGRVPFGYRLEDKRLALGDNHDVQVVRDIFAWYIGGDSIRAIAHRLNSKGELRNGKSWLPAAVQRILTNVAYTGTYRWNKEPGGKYHGVVDGEVADAGNGNHADDWIVIPDNHPAIVDQQTFDAVQQRLAERKLRNTPHKNGGKYVLSGLVRCGKCGATMYGTMTSERRQNVTYICNTRAKTGKCDRNAAKQDELLSAVVDAVVDRFMNPSVVDRMRKILRKKATATTSTTNTARTRHELSAVESKLGKAKRRLLEVDTDMIPIVSGQIRELTSRRDELHAALKAAEMPPERRLADVDAKVDKAMELFVQLRDTLQRADTVKLRELLSRAIEKVEVWSVSVPQSPRRQTYDLERGVIHLRSDQFDKLSHSSSRSDLRVRRDPPRR